MAWASWEHLRQPALPQRLHGSESAELRSPGREPVRDHLGVEELHQCVDRGGDRRQKLRVHRIRRPAPLPRGHTNAVDAEYLGHPHVAGKTLPYPQVVADDDLAGGIAPSDEPLPAITDIRWNRIGKRIK